MKNHFIYKTVNKITDDFYIGYHFGDVSDSYLGSGLILNRAIKKYGRKNFNREILEIVSKDTWREREKYWIKDTDAINKGYNIMLGGNGGNTITNHPDKDMILEKISKKLKGRISEKRGVKNTKIKGRISPTKGMKMPSQFCKDISIRQTGVGNSFFGKHHSDSFIKNRIENNPNSKCVNYFGVVYKTKTECIKANNITRYRFDNLIKNGVIHYVEDL
jgi:group I intron endonuclease